MAEKNTGLIDSTINEFYSKAAEDKRLGFGLGPLEFERNCDLILRYLPGKKSSIADVGGGPGVYAAWLSDLGHSVVLIDPVEKHIRQAKKRSSECKKPFKVLFGEARHLDLPDNSVDLVILHGPLYHLQQKTDRLAAIAEAKRIVKQGGFLLGFAINFTASALTGLLSGMIHDKAFYAMCEEELSTGLHHPAPDLPGVLAEAYFHRPQELQSEFEEAGLQEPDLYAVEGMIWLDSNYFETRSNPEKKKAMMHLLKLTEKEPAIMAISPHIMVAGRKFLDA